MATIKKKFLLLIILMLLIVGPYVKENLDDVFLSDFGKTSLFETYLHYQKAKMGVMPVTENKTVKQRVKRILGEDVVHEAAEVQEKIQRVATTASLSYLHDPVCQYKMPEEPLLKAEFKGVKKPARLKSGNEFKVTLLMENTGNVRWYGDNSGCLNQRYVRLGTDLERDRESVFFSAAANSGWLSKNRVKMLEETVDPGAVATFEFTAAAPAEKDLYREYFSPLMETYAWFEDAAYYVDLAVGLVKTETQEKMGFMSQSVRGSALEGEKNVLVDLSEQKMKLKFGETIVREFPVSTGKRATPTPKGDFEILNRMEVRVGGAWPHYVMPKWQGFTKWGHGLHALPSLKNDGGVFWTEARNHIGIPVSHGCIRLLPEDADFMFDFGELEMTLKIVQ